MTGITVLRASVLTYRQNVFQKVNAVNLAKDLEKYGGNIP